MTQKEKARKFYLLAALLLLLLVGCTPTSPAPQATPNPPTPSGLIPTPTGTPSPVFLTVEEYALQGAPTTEPFSFTPQQGTMEDILARHERERSEGIVDNSFYTDDGQVAWRVNLGGDELVATENYSQAGSEGWISVTRNGEEIYRIETGPASPYNALRGFWTYDDHWVLETASIPPLPVDNSVALEPAGQITQDGELLNDRLGYEEMFGFQMMAGRPFYFFKKDGKIGYAYDGQVVEAGYDEIPHYNCCSAGALNPRAAQNMIAFFARRGEQWSYVELGVFPARAAGVTPTSSSTLTPMPTPRYVMDLSGYDPDLFPPIDISHNPPLIARSDETVEVVLDFANTFCMKFPVSCIPEGTLYYSYGNDEDFQTIPLANEIVDEMESLVASLPAANQDGESLRYYAEFAVPEAGYTQRYPEAGMIDVFAAADFIPVELPPEQEVKPGEVVYDFFWGYGPGMVRQATYEYYPQRVGPPAIDVADDGRMALLDPVNERVLVFNPKDGSYASFPLPFTYGFFADLGFDPQGRLMVCDYQGEEVEETFGPDPVCYLLDPDGQLSASTPVYVKSPAKMTGDLKILDYADSRLVAPFNSQGQANPREAQRQKVTWSFPLRYVEGKDPYLAHYADVKEGAAFEVHSASPLGVLTDFEKTPQGYLLVFSLGDRIRAVWIDAEGAVLKDVTLPKGQYSEINFNGQAAVTQDGSLYAMGSTERGIEVHVAGPPG